MNIIVLILKDAHDVQDITNRNALRVQCSTLPVVYLECALPAGGGDEVVGPAHGGRPGDVVHGAVVLAQLTLLLIEYNVICMKKTKEIKHTTIIASLSLYLLEGVSLERQHARHLRVAAHGQLGGLEWAVVPGDAGETVLRAAALLTRAIGAVVAVGLE